jgi:hypothetical protein
VEHHADRPTWEHFAVESSFYRKLAEAAATEVSGVLLSWNHTHSAPPATRSMLHRSGLLETDGDDRIDRYAEFLASRIVEAASLAAVLPNPRRYKVNSPGPYVRERQQWILQQMNQLGGSSLVRKFE